MAETEIATNPSPWRRKSSRFLYPGQAIGSLVWLVREMERLPLSVGSDAGPSRRPELDLNQPPAPEPAPGPPLTPIQLNELRKTETLIRKYEGLLRYWEGELERWHWDEARIRAQKALHEMKMSIIRNRKN